MRRAWNSKALSGWIGRASASALMMVSRKGRQFMLAGTQEEPLTSVKLAHTDGWTPFSSGCFAAHGPAPLHQLEPHHPGRSGRERDQDVARAERRKAEHPGERRHIDHRRER